MSLNNFYIGIVTKDRPELLKKLLRSLRFQIDKVRIVDASEQSQFGKVKDLLYDSKKYIHNNLDGYKSVNHNKNILIHDFLKGPCEYLFLIEDDVKILDDEVFEEYIRVSKKYNLPHMNAILPFQDDIIYTLNEDLDICNRLYGFFQFFTRSCLECMDHHYRPELDKQCWEHVEFTARIHKKFNFNPVFFHFPDIHNSYEYIKNTSTKSTTDVTKDIVEAEKEKMFKLLGWKNFPIEDITKLNINTIKSI